MDVVTKYGRYGALVGVYSEWHQVIYRLAQMFAPRGKPYGLAYIMEFARQIIADRVRQGKPREPGADFISLMYEMHLQNPSAFTIDEILFHSVPNIGAGSDTTAIAQSAVLYFLCRNPAVLEKLREEIGQKLRERDPDELNQLMSVWEAQECPYLQAVIKEAMRMHPSTGLPLPRVIPKGGLVLAGRYFPADVGSSSSMM